MGERKLNLESLQRAWDIIKNPCLHPNGYDSEGVCSICNYSIYPIKIISYDDWLKMQELKRMMDKGCKIIECGSKYHSKGLCRLHYNRWRLNKPLIRLCVDCSSNIEDRGNAAIRCLSCAKIQATIKDKNWRNENKERLGIYRRAYEKQTLFKRKRKDYLKEYRSRPEVIKHIKDYYNNPEIKLRRSDYMKEYNQRPEVKERRRLFDKNRYLNNNEWRNIWRLSKRKRRVREKEQLGYVSKNIDINLLIKQQFICANPKCSRVLALGKLNNRIDYELDHIIPLSLGGIHDDVNFQILCTQCNRKKLNRLIY